MFVEDKPVITNTPSKHPVVSMKQQKERLGGEANIYFTRNIFLTVTSLVYFSPFHGFEVKSKKILSRQFSPELSEGSFPNVSAK